MITCPHCGKEIKRVWRPREKWLRENAPAIRLFLIHLDQAQRPNALNVSSERLKRIRARIAEVLVQQGPEVYRVESYLKAEAVLLKGSPFGWWSVNFAALDRVRASLHALKEPATSAAGAPALMESHP